MSTVPTTTPASLSDASYQLSAAHRALDEWHAKQTDPARRRSYISAGHEAIAAIDAASRALYTARGALIDEIRRDEDERAVRTDLALAEWHQQRAKQAAAAEQADRPEQVTGEPLPEGVEGYPVRRA